MQQVVSAATVTYKGAAVSEEPEDFLQTWRRGCWPPLEELSHSQLASRQLLNKEWCSVERRNRGGKWKSTLFVLLKRGKEFHYILNHWKVFPDYCKHQSNLPSAHHILLITLLLKKICFHAMGYSYFITLSPCT
jgi:hypothetical protein